MEQAQTPGIGDAEPGEGLTALPVLHHHFDQSKPPVLEHPAHLDHSVRAGCSKTEIRGDGQQNQAVS